MRAIIAIAIIAPVILGSRPGDASTGLNDCVNVAPSGGDDRPAIQAAIVNALGTTGKRAVCFSGGTYRIQSTTSGSVSFDLGNPAGTGPATQLAFIGTGAGTVLLLDGAATGPWTLFKIDNGAQRILFRDLTLDASSATMAATTLVQIGSGTSGASDLDFDGVRLRAANVAAMQLRGSPTAATVTGISIRGATFANNTGTAVDIFEGVQRLAIRSSYFVNDAGIDIRASYATTPTTAGAIDGLSIAANVMSRQATAAPVSLALGSSLASSRDAVVEGNVLVNGRIQLISFDRAKLAGNLVLGGCAATADPELFVHIATHLLVTGNHITRGTTVDGAACPTLTAGNVVAVDDGRVQRAQLQGNLLVQATPATIARLVQVSNLSATGNVLRFTCAASACTSPNGFITLAGISVGNAGGSIAAVNLTDNIVLGDEGVNAMSQRSSLGFAFDIGPGDGVLGSVVVANNVSRGALVGVNFQPTQNLVAKPIVTANQFTGATTDVAGFSSTINAIALGGNIGAAGAAVLSGTDDPTVTDPPAAIGSLYLRRGATGLYVRESAGWHAK
jgi:hypothetical protein